MIIKECNGNEERKQRQANQPNTQKKAKQPGEKKAMKNEKKTIWYTSVGFGLICHIFLFFFSKQVKLFS